MAFWRTGGGVAARLLSLPDASQPQERSYVGPSSCGSNGNACVWVPTAVRILCMPHGSHIARSTNGAVEAAAAWGVWEDEVPAMAPEPRRSIADMAAEVTAAICP